MSTRYLGGTCGNKGVNIVLIESVLYHLICQSSNLIDFVNFSSEMKVIISGEIAKCMGEIQDVEYSIKEEENVPNRLLELYEKSMIQIEVFNERFTLSNDKIHRLKEQLSKLRKKVVTKNAILKSPKLSRVKQLRDSIKDREKLKEYFRLFFDKVVVLDVGNNIIKVAVYVKLVNESRIKFTIEIDKDGIKKIQKVYQYTITECILIINGKGYMIMNRQFKEGGDVKNIGVEVERILSSLNLPIGLEDQRETAVYENILMNKTIQLDESQIIEFY